MHQLNNTDMAKYITKKEIKGAKINDYVNDLLNDINAKGDINGRYFSSWWFDIHHNIENNNAMNEIIWGLVLNYAKTNASWFNNKTEAQLRLNEVTEYIANKLNTWSGIIIRWLKGMQYCKYGVDVCDKCGLNTLFIKIK